METLVVHPKDENQLAAIKAFMQALDIDFEKQDDSLSEYVINRINESRLEAKEGKLIEFKGVKDMLL